MTDLSRYLDANLFTFISSTEQAWLAEVFKRFGDRYPTLEEIWQLMDEAWYQHRCDADVMDERIGKFYSDPVWLLNGLFIEQHSQSLENRRQFTDWVVRQKPQRVADYGGGFGGLARMIAQASPQTSVEVIEPHAHPAAIALAAKTPNVSYQPALTGHYDVLIATDVFEHVPDPLALALEGASFLRPGGQYLIANCFFPVIKSHLPQTFHFRWSWDAAMRAARLEPGERVAYGRAFHRAVEPLDEVAARRIESRSNAWHGIIEKLPGRLRGRTARFLFPTN